MNRLAFTFTLIMISTVAFCQIKYDVQVSMPGYKQNDTINLTDLLNREYMFQCDKNFPVVSFVLVYNYSNIDYMMISKSNKLTDDMKNRLSRFAVMKIKILKISFKAITVETSSKEQIKSTQMLKYILRIQ